MQLPDDRGQEVGLNAPPAGLSLQVTVPFVIAAELELLVTVTVNVTELVDNVTGFGVTATVVEYRA